MTLNVKRIRAQAARIAEQDEVFDEEEEGEEDEAQPEQETIPQGGSGWPSWLKWSIFLLIVVFLVWYIWFTGQTPVQQEEDQAPPPLHGPDAASPDHPEAQRESHLPELPEIPQPSASNGTFRPALDQSAAPFSSPESMPNEASSTIHIWPTENW